MAKQSRFRKVYIVCEDNKIFNCTNNITVYKERDSAEYFCKRCIDKAKEEQGNLWNANKPLPNFKVHGFYLVHEDLFRS